MNAGDGHLIFRMFITGVWKEKNFTTKETPKKMFLIYAGKGFDNVFRCVESTSK